MSLLFLNHKKSLTLQAMPLKGADFSGKYTRCKASEEDLLYIRHLRAEFVSSILVWLLGLYSGDTLQSAAMHTGFMPLRIKTDNHPVAVLVLEHLHLAQKPEQPPFCRSCSWTSYQQ